MKKIIFACVVLLLSLCLLVPCFAEEASTPSGETIDEAQGTPVPEEKPESETDGTIVPEEKPESETEETIVPEEETESEWNLGNFFDKYASTIFTVLSTLGVSIVAYLFKGALLPSMKNGLVALSDISQKTHDISEKTAGSVHDAMNAVANVSDKILALTEQIKNATAENGKQRDILFAVLLILQEGFTAAKLPEYTKDRINSAIAKVTKQMEVTANEETV